MIWFYFENNYFQSATPSVCYTRQQNVNLCPKFEQTLQYFEEAYGVWLVSSAHEFIIRHRIDVDAHERSSLMVSSHPSLTCV